jgi:hypothetical protein
VEFIHADILDWVPRAKTYDLIVTNYFLDCFRGEQLEQIIPKIAGWASPGANWLIADFKIADRGWKRVRSRAILELLYQFFRVVTRLPADRLTKPDPLLEKVGFTLSRRSESEWGLLHSDWWRKTA